MLKNNKVINKKFLCIIPARGGSKGIPNKNIIDLNGFPLISYSIRSAKKSNIFDRIIVSTDSKEIALVAKQYGAEVPFLRPKEISGDKSLVEDAIFYTLERIEKYDYVCLLQPTSPLLTEEDLKNSLNMLFDKKADMVISVSKPLCNIDLIGKLGKDGSMKDFHRNNVYGTLRQDFEDKYVLNGAIYFGKWDVFYKKEDYYSQNAYGYIIPQEKSVDIDSYLDLKFTEFLLKNKE